MGKDSCMNARERESRGRSRDVRGEEEEERFRWINAKEGGREERIWLRQGRGGGGSRSRDRVERRRGKKRLGELIPRERKVRVD